MCFRPSGISLPIKCPECGTLNDPDATKCVKCGLSVEDVSLPGMPGAAGMPGMPSAPGAPSMPGMPSAPGAPSMPGTPSVPGMPSAPGKPGGNA